MLLVRPIVNTIAVTVASLVPFAAAAIPVTTETVSIVLFLVVQAGSLIWILSAQQRRLTAIEGALSGGSQKMAASAEEVTALRVQVAELRGELRAIKEAR